ncbi:MAG: pyrroline-5-carboxylate reductase [Deltaproteobacteria bacterium]|nr:pyrroline-5-carboxylate reductase [Deltaproteobacteria bacterium]
MGLNDIKTGFIGAGNMGGAMIGALVRAGVSPSQILVTDKRDDYAKSLGKSYGIRVFSSNTEIVQKSDIVVLAVKPQVMDDVLDEFLAAGSFGRPDARKILISIAAGIPISRIERAVPENARANVPIIRVMPNTPALVGAAMSAMCANSFANNEDIDTVRKILSTMGDVIICPERLMDAVTAVSGSGPAYCFYLAEAMIQAAKELGFSDKEARQLTLSTILGSARLMSAEKDDPEVLRKKVTSPGGTTEAAVGVLEDNGVKQTIISAIKAAAKKSHQLSKSE